MTPFPDFRQFGYEVTECLNNNATGGRITYKALDLNSQQAVVIKQFCFAKTNNWDEYKAIEREIEVLRGLKHPGIPKFLTKFDPGDGLCFVQEYKNAAPLSKPRTFSPEEIKDIANQILEILIYLQNQIPIIIHKDLKPENILVDDNIKVYLIDFGLARIGNNTMAFSTMMGGTLGFMPPEQVHNQKLTEASDLYGLGATLICLITQTKTADIGKLVNFSTNRIIFKDRVPKFSFKFIQWLEKMVEPEPVNRFPDAKTALEALQPLYIVRIPDITFDKSELRFFAGKVGERLSPTITLKNTVSETILQGQWYVAPHPNDPPHTPDDHVWIRITPKRFEAHYEEEVTCTITIDTSKLKADKFYQREIVLESNANEERICFNVSIQTAKIKFDVAFPPYLALLGLGVVLGFSSVGLFNLYGWILTQNLLLKSFGLGAFGGLIGGIWGGILGLFLGFEVPYDDDKPWYRLRRKSWWEEWAWLIMTSTTTIGIIFVWTLNWESIGLEINPDGYIWTWWPWDSLWKSISLYFMFGCVIAIGLLGGTLSGGIFGAIIAAFIGGGLDSYAGGNFFTNLFHKRPFKNRWTVASYILLTSCVSISTGLGFVSGFNTYLLTASVLSAVSLTGLSIYPPLRLQYLKSQYRQQESRKLIEP
ncbi:serine/threonine-protein kinase D [Microcystis aeruginosa NIES-2519]|uniref:Serine/threonine-protein kinase D n=1 Tax=Microcystis aeruginosa NIES-2519 TaxID=2303981 RepID=A0A5A5RFB9_MICAE|nr:serine/threonine-protein kinase [Microcystis aeruginosa]GCA71867.1 serine/threonine-protein kinase D [Microcystis aeruginosa NIES-2519]